MVLLTNHSFSHIGRRLDEGLDLGEGVGAGDGGDLAGELGQQGALELLSESDRGALGKMCP